MEKEVFALSPLEVIYDPIRSYRDAKDIARHDEREREREKNGEKEILSIKVRPLTTNINRLVDDKCEIRLHNVFFFCLLYYVHTVLFDQGMPRAYRATRIDARREDKRFPN